MTLSLETTIKLNNGVDMPILGFGSWKLERKQVKDPIKWAIDSGYRHIDTATLYNNEKYIGNALKDIEVDREDLFITSKVWDSDQGYEQTQKAFEKSLKNLNTDYLDLYLIHWPREQRKETWKALEKIYDEGKARAIGVANFATHHIKELLEKFETVPAVNQFELHPFNYSEQEELISLCKEKGIQVEAYSPLTHGKKLGYDLLESIASNYDKLSAQILIRWSLQHNFICIPKSGNKQHIRENTEVFDFELSEEEMDKIDSIDENFRLLYDTSKWD
ncbi:MAG: aldo/keto reductase [Candidatus Lokiarchaeota archaeon]|nr:aldo/keto reductase [Candidatus Lokiarchaeota archaeon]MBD3200662.1 aldo/keto reductase [Candidatus Lokiarchaeota archaeon]